MYIDAITLTTLVLDDNPLALRDQSVSIDAMLDLTQTLQVLSCRRCGLQVDVETLIPPAASFAAEPKQLQELHLAQVTPGLRRWQLAGGELSALQKSGSHSHRCYLFAIFPVCVCSEFAERRSSHEHVFLFIRSDPGDAFSLATFAARAGPVVERRHLWPVTTRWRRIRRLRHHRPVKHERERSHSAVVVGVPQSAAYRRDGHQDDVHADC